MKTTNFENSKKLAEIGFKAETPFYWQKRMMGEGQYLMWHNPDHNIQEDLRDGETPAFILETILEALPDRILDKKSASSEERLQLFKDHICYDSEFVKYAKFITWKEGEESLADTAARLLITLAEQGIINFNK